MKFKLIIYFCFTSSLCAMQNDIFTSIMISSIESGSIKEFPQLIEEIRKSTQQNLTTKKNLIENADIYNLHFYKNIASGVVYLSGAATLMGLFVYTPALHEQTDFLKNGVKIGAPVSALTFEGAQQIRSAFNSEDAYNEYAKSLAIKLLLRKVKKSSKEQA